MQAFFTHFFTFLPKTWLFHKNVENKYAPLAERMLHFSYQDAPVIAPLGAQYHAGNQRL